MNEGAATTSSSFSITRCRWFIVFLFTSVKSRIFNLSCYWWIFQLFAHNAVGGQVKKFTFSLNRGRALSAILKYKKEGGKTFFDAKKKREKSLGNFLT